MTVIALLDVRVKADKVVQAQVVFAEILVQTKAFPGNQGVEVIADVDDPTHLVAVERWESIEADNEYRAYRAGEGAEALKALGPLLAGAPVLTRGTLVG